jgi:hypothetical protein
LKPTLRSRTQKRRDAQKLKAYQATGREPQFLPGKGPGGASAGIDPKTGQIMLYDNHNEFSLLHELIHYEQLVNRGLLGKAVSEFGPETRQILLDMEMQVQRILQNMGLIYEISSFAK